MNSTLHTPLLIIVMLLYVSSVSAKNIYVSSKKGNDIFDGSHYLKPKKTIQAAEELTKPGDTVFVMDGVYTNDCAACNVLNITRSGKKNKYIVYTAMQGHHPVISFDGWAGFFITNGASFVQISGFEVIGGNQKLTLSAALKQPMSCQNKKGTPDPKYNGNGIVIDGNGKKMSHHIIISQNTVHDCPGGGIGASHADYVTVEGNLIYNTSWYSVFGNSGISFYQFYNSDNGKGYHNIIRANKCYNNKSLVPWFKNCEIMDGNGIIVDDFRSRQNGSKLGNYRGRTLIENNICWYNGGTGIHTFQSDHVDIINNTAYCNSQDKHLNAGQILSGLGNDNRIVGNILVSDGDNIINSNYYNTNFTYENNLHFNLSTPGKEVVNVTSKTCIAGTDPDFVMPANSLKADFHLKPNSPANHKANTVLHPGVDFDGRPRPDGKACSMGAFEIQ
ncbi:right-handed parallel beta-helix repeat-containing protein [Mucilaginibacter straminoryzae]|nr:right-handed parallel beta-helix repeat-containing protein [Mucilaginibacter straminoryzae]